MITYGRQDDPNVNAVLHVLYCCGPLRGFATSRPKHIRCRLDLVGEGRNLLDDWCTSGRPQREWGFWEEYEWEYDRVDGRGGSSGTNMWSQERLAKGGLTTWEKTQFALPVGTRGQHPCYWPHDRERCYWLTDLESGPTDEECPECWTLRLLQMKRYAKHGKGENGGTY